MGSDKEREWKREGDTFTQPLTDFGTPKGKVVVPLSLPLQIEGCGSPEITTTSDAAAANATTPRFFDQKGK